MMKIYNSSGTEILDVVLDDNSYRQRQLMGEHRVYLYFSLATFVEFPLGSYIEFEGVTYTLNRPATFKMIHTRQFDYTLVFDSAESDLSKWLFRNPIDNRIKFSLTAKPQEHLQMLVDNLNLRSSGWSVGEYVDSEEKLINYDSNYLIEALQLMADTFDTEYSFDGQTINLCKVTNDDEAVELSYGKGNGIRSGLMRQSTDKVPAEIVIPQGGDRNIDLSTYGSKYLHLPKSASLGYDGEHFSDEEDYDSSKAKTYITDSNGLHVRQSGQSMTLAEDALDCSEIYPKYIGSVQSLRAGDYPTFHDGSAPDFTDCVIEGERMMIVFQSGNLAGREFEVDYKYTSATANIFHVIPTEIDGVVMPQRDSAFYFAVGDKYVIYNVRMPQDYVNDTPNKSGAEWDMFRKCIKYLWENGVEKFSYTAEVDSIWAKDNWDEIATKIELGYNIMLSDARFLQTPTEVRIVGIKEYINDKYAPIIELSNEPIASGFASRLAKLENTEISIDNKQQQSIQFTKRRYEDAIATAEALVNALGGRFSEAINPISVHTMQTIVGDESLQFRWINNTTAYSEVAPTFTWDKSTKKLSVSNSGIVQHMTLGHKDMSSSYSNAERLYWNINSEFRSQVVSEDAPYYLYIRANKADHDAFFVLTTSTHELDTTLYYYLLVGVLNKEDSEGERSFAPLYGFTEILPNRITTERIVSGNGQSFLDLINNAFQLAETGSNYGLYFNVNGDGKLIIKGSILQTTSGEDVTMGVFRGTYSASTTYYNGDTCTYQDANGSISTYRYIYATPSSGHVPTNTSYWAISAKGAKGSDGTSFNVKGSGIELSSTTEIPEGVQTDDIAYIVGRDRLYKYNGTSWSIYSSSVSNGDAYYITMRYGDVAGEVHIIMKVEDHFIDLGNMKGTAGEDGSDGVGITSMRSRYYLSTSNTSQSGGSWRWDTPYSHVDGKYLWKQDYVYYSNNTSWNSAPYLVTGDKGDKGNPGDDGADADFYEFRYCKNGSPTIAPTITDRSARNPQTGVSGQTWGTTMPSVGVAEYLWLTIAKVKANGLTLAENWTTPIRTNGVDGEQGEKGDSPALVFRGTYSSASGVLYYGNSKRIDCVKYNNIYYVARTDAPNGESGFNVVPTNTSYWNEFGAQFESVATQLLLAENANIAGFIFRDNKLYSQNNQFFLDGVNGEMRLGGTLQMSTADVTYQQISQNFPDANVINLKDTGQGFRIMNIILPNGNENIGKNIFIKNGDSNGWLSVEGYKVEYENGQIASFVGRTTALVPPLSVVQFVCFENKISNINSSYEWRQISISPHLLYYLLLTFVDGEPYIDLYDCYSFRGTYIVKESGDIYGIEKLNDNHIKLTLKPSDYIVGNTVDEGTHISNISIDNLNISGGCYQSNYDDTIGRITPIIEQNSGYAIIKEFNIWYNNYFNSDVYKWQMYLTESQFVPIN